MVQRIRREGSVNYLTFIMKRFEVSHNVCDILYLDSEILDGGDEAIVDIVVSAIIPNSDDVISPS